MRLEYFQLVDRVEEIDPVGGVIRATAQVPAKSTIFEGHFEGYPILPGVLLVECMAQTAPGVPLRAIMRGICCTQVCINLASQAVVIHWMRKGMRI